jgi:hypothetical protein
MQLHLAIIAIILYIYTQGTLLRKIKNKASLPSQPGPIYPIFREWITKNSTGVSLLQSTTWPRIYSVFAGKQRISTMLTQCRPLTHDIKE